MRENLSDIPFIPEVCVLKRRPSLPLLQALQPDIYGRSYEGRDSVAAGPAHLVELTTAYRTTGVPFAVINMGIPKSGKTLLSGEQLAFLTSKFSDGSMLFGREGLQQSLAYIPYEGIQQLVEQTGEVPVGHGPGNQTWEDHKISSKRLEKEIYKSLLYGQAVVAEAPFFAGRGELKLLHDVVNHSGVFRYLPYNVKIFWPIPDRVHEIFTMMTRIDFLTKGRRDAFSIRNIRTHTESGGEGSVTIPGANEFVLRKNFYPDLYSHLSQLYAGLVNSGFSEVQRFDVLFRPSKPWTQSPLAMVLFMREIASKLFTLLRIPPEVALVGTNSVLPAGIQVEYYEGLLRYFDKFKNSAAENSSNT